ncbi:Aspartic protease PEP1 [Diplodia seriata]|uniref:Aspartic protease PEP1 n=1 Tax=Diplodia seriata TaxID=420778 RepID=A0A1S8B6K1_9PEZI|nr:Aspartic protease PEP1 [Diplodia seriata]
MPSFRTVAACAAILSLATATPIEKRGKTFTCEQVKRGSVARNGPAQMLKAFNKFGGVAPTEVVSAAAAGKTGSAGAVPEDEIDTLYLTPVTVGDTTLQLDMDTGSSDLWVFSTLLSDSNQSNHSVYDPTVSGTKQDGSSWNITYGDGSGAAGTVYADKVVVGGVTATSQAVEAATSISSSFVEDTDTDGILGLAFGSLNTVKPEAQVPFFDTVADDLAEKLFAVTLKRGEAGSYDFGFRNESKYTGDIAYVDVDTSNGFWEFAPSGYAVGNGSVVNASIDAIADTGTSLLLLPEAIVTAYYDTIEGSAYFAQFGGFVFPCGDVPDFTLVIGGQERTVPGEYINYSAIFGPLCYGGIQVDTGIGYSIIGDIFLKVSSLETCTMKQNANSAVVAVCRLRPDYYHPSPGLRPTGLNYQQETRGPEIDERAACSPSVHNSNPTVRYIGPTFRKIQNRHSNYFIV